MSAYVARPESGGAGKGLIILQEAFGVNAHIRDITDRFARAGYTSIAPALFHRTSPNFEGSYTDFPAAMPHMQALTDDGQGADIRAAYAWLTTEGNASTVGAVGYCMGGRASFLANTLLPIHASVSYYGGGIAPGNKPVPDLRPEAKNLHGPILLFWGGKDESIGLDIRRSVEDAIIEAGKPYETVTFSEAGHGFFCDMREAYNPDAARQAWPLTLAFFETYLR